MMTTEQLAAIKARVERPMEDTWPLRADIRALVAEVERLQRIEAAAKALMQGGSMSERVKNRVELSAALRAAGSGE